MPGYTLAELEELTRNIPSRYIPSPLAHDNISLSIHNVTGQGDPMTRHEIAKAIGRKKSTWLTKKIEKMAEDGFLYKERALWANGVPVYLYTATLPFGVEVIFV